MWLLVRPEGELDATERAARWTLLEASATIATAADLTQRFGQLVRERTAAALDPWLEAAMNSGVGEIKYFATSLRRDYAAVRAALVTNWSNGQAETTLVRANVASLSIRMAHQRRP